MRTWASEILPRWEIQKEKSLRCQTLGRAELWNRITKHEKVWWNCWRTAWNSAGIPCSAADTHGSSSFFFFFSVERVIWILRVVRGRNSSKLKFRHTAGMQVAVVMKLTLDWAPISTDLCNFLYLCEYFNITQIVANIIETTVSFVL